MWVYGDSLVRDYRLEQNSSPLPNLKEFVLGGFKAKLESCDQLPNLLRVLFISISSEVKSRTAQGEYKVVSSAYRAHLVVAGMMLLKSAT